uniref:Uncharacterized protein n=1 Tax=Glossina austeni TaxID=7395 RepID=A0A1A9VDV9_GLOAU
MRLYVCHEECNKSRPLFQFFPLCELHKSCEQTDDDGDDVGGKIDLKSYANQQICTHYDIYRISRSYDCILCGESKTYKSLFSSVVLYNDDDDYDDDDNDSGGGGGGGESKTAICAARPINVFAVCGKA